VIQQILVGGFKSGVKFRAPASGGTKALTRNPEKAIDRVDEAESANLSRRRSDWNDVVLMQ